MNKKGSSYLLAVAEVLAVIIVMIMVIWSAQKRATSDTIQERNLANNLFLMINTQIGNAGDSLVEYPYTLSKFNIVLTPTSVSVSLPGESSLQYQSRNLNLPQGLTAEGIVQQTEKVCLEKKSNKILLRPC
jgi:hypothetical protein